MIRIVLIQVQNNQYACQLRLALDLKHFVVGGFCSFSDSQQQNKSLQNRKIDFDNISDNPKSFFFWKIVMVVTKVTEVKLLCCDKLNAILPFKVIYEKHQRELLFVWVLLFSIWVL